MKTDVKETKEYGIYVHVPFCKNKCLYCDFYSGGSRIADWQKYGEAIKNELNQRVEEINYPISTLYFGGGTPSLIPDLTFKDIISKIKETVGLNNLKEFTIEVNPEDVSLEKIRNWKEAGVNRISIGIQSFNDRDLKIIGRKHNSGDAENAINMLKSNFENVSLDLMFGLPGQNLISYKNTLQKAIALHPTHISAYSLMLEEGTALNIFVKNKKLTIPSEDEWLEMYELTNSLLKEYGYFRYEISNYGKPGFESVHNLNYWLGKPYLGLGPGAHSYDGKRKRIINPNDLKGWLNYYGNCDDIAKNTAIETRVQKPLKKEKKFYETEILSDEELKEEFIMTRMRMVAGLNIEEYEKKFGVKEKDNLIKRALTFIQRRLLQYNENNISFTKDGFRLSDEILARLI